MSPQQLAEESPHKYNYNWQNVDSVFVFVDIANNYNHLHHTLNCEQPNRSDAIIHRAGTRLTGHWLNGK